VPEGDGGRNYPKPWLAGEPGKPGKGIEEVKGQLGDQYINRIYLLGSQRSWSIATRTEMGQMLILFEC